MSLADDIRHLRDRSQADLDAAHDYYIHTQHAWRFIQQLVSLGYRPSFENRATGNVVEATQLPGLAQKYVTQYLAPATFQQFVSLFENFVFDFLRLWLVAYPKSLAGK